MQAPKPTGFTLIEMMIAIAIGAILMAIAVPNFRSFVRNNHLITETNTLVGHINVARSEAIKRNRSVVLCRSADPNAVNPVCGGTSKVWTTGWLVYVNETGGTEYNNDGVEPDDDLLKRWVPKSGNISLNSNGTFDNYLVYKGDGTLDEGGVATMAICYGLDVTTGRQIDVALSGRPTLIKGSVGSPLASCTP